jgi:RimJ/RimL family protein N-acetyltransferase
MRIYLRAFEPDDYRLISAWRHDDEVTNLLGGNHFFVSQAREKQWVEDKSVGDNRNIYLAICLSDDDRMVGYTSINNIDLRNQKAEWGGTIIGDKTMWGKGIAAEAARQMLKYLFYQYPIHKCYGYCLEEHKITERMLLSLGFSCDGICRDEVFKNGEFKNILLFSILRDEYLEKYKGLVPPADVES